MRPESFGPALQRDDALAHAARENTLKNLCFSPGQNSPPHCRMIVSETIHQYFCWIVFKHSGAPLVFPSGNRDCDAFSRVPEKHQVRKLVFSSRREFGLGRSHPSRLPVRTNIP